MSSALKHVYGNEHIAEKYSVVNGPQIEFGRKFVALIGIKEGNKVLDMGCGTGELTAFIADQVGKEGQVVGVEPDQEKIKLAVRNHCGVTKNLIFTVGSSSIHFPHCNGEYYDIHFSNFVFHWLSTEDKHIFFETAFRCLKPRGRIAIQSHEKHPEIMTEMFEVLLDGKTYKSPSHYVKKAVTESLLKKSGFVIQYSEYVQDDRTFTSLDDFIAWCCASNYVDERKIIPHKKKDFARKFVNKDGTVRLSESSIYQIIAEKQLNT